MSPRLSQSILVAAALCAAAFSYTGWREIADLNNSHIATEEVLSTLTTTWVDAENLTHTVTTHRQEGETADAFAARHKEEVDALKALYPPA